MEVRWVLIVIQSKRENGKTKIGDLLKKGLMDTIRRHFATLRTSTRQGVIKEDEVDVFITDMWRKVSGKRSWVHGFETEDEFSDRCCKKRDVGTFIDFWLNFEIGCDRQVMVF